jgi:hypothetical protein
MKILVLKIGARIVKGGSSGGSIEAISIIEMLKKNHDVTCYTKILDKDEKIDNINFLQIEDNYENLEFDALVVVNGNVNFFGGAESKLDILNYHIINNFKNKVYYILCDPNLTLKQIWESVEKKPWGSKYSKENLFIKREDIIYISQPYDISAVQDLIKKTNITITDIKHFPLYKFTLQNKRLEYNSNKNIDILYGGTFRGGRRENKMIKYLFDYPDDINIKLVGNIKIENFKPKKIENLKIPEILKPLEYFNFLNKMNESISTIIIGDKWYEGKNLNQRIYEAIISNTITFIDLEFDPQMKIYKSDFLRNYCYVNSKEEIIQKIKKLKESLITEPNVIKMICDLQYEDVQINFDEYCKEFSNLIIQ